MPLDPKELYTIPAGVQTRWASPENARGEKGAGGATNGGRKGQSNVPLKAGESRVLAEAAGTSGMLRRIWITISKRDPAMLRSLRIDIYWDGAAKPAVSAPLGDFFGTGLGQMVKFQSAFFSNPEARSFNCCLPMPFRRGMKAVLTNEGSVDEGSLYYDVDYTIGDVHGPDALYLHAHWRRESPTTFQKDFEFLPKVRGRGRFLGVNVGVIADKKLSFESWWGEGECKIWIDGDTDLPTLCGTGTEDYIGTAWGQGQYDHLYQGCHLADHAKMHFCFYRYHVPDPVWFHRDIRVAMQQIGCWDPKAKPLFHYAGKPIPKAATGMPPLDFSAQGGLGDYGLFERQDDWSSCAYVYLDRPENDLPALAPVAARVAGLA